MNKFQKMQRENQNSDEIFYGEKLLQKYIFLIDHLDYLNSKKQQNNKEKTFFYFKVSRTG